MPKHPRKPPERIDAEAARELLGLHHTPDLPEENSEEDAWLFWHVQLRIIKGPHAEELARLHTHCTAHPEDTAATAQQEAILLSMGQEATAELRERRRQVSSGQYADLWNINPNWKPEAK